MRNNFFMPFVRHVKNGRDDQATGNSIIWCMCFAFWITKSTDTHSQNM